MGQLVHNPKMNANNIRIQNSRPMLMNATLSPVKAFVILLCWPFLLLGQSVIETQILWTISYTSVLPVTYGTNNPLAIPHVGLSAYWIPPDNDTNFYWQPEFNLPPYNGTNWDRCGNHWCGMGGWNSTETGTNWVINGLPLVISNQWTVRIRRVTVPPPPPPSPPPPPLNAGTEFFQ